MRLDLGPGNIWMAHFHRPTYPSAASVRAMGRQQDSRPLVICYLHPAPCIRASRPCDTPNMFKGMAICSHLDQFVKSTGRKIAFTRALAKTKLSRAERALMWREYFKHNAPPPTKHPRTQRARNARGGGSGVVTNEVGPIPGGDTAKAS